MDNNLINGKYRVEGSIDKEFNTIADTRAGVNIKTGESVEITLSSKNSNALLYNHFKYHRNLSNYNTSGSTILCIPRVYYFGDYGQNTVLVSEKVGLNLQQYFNSKGNQLETGIIADIAVKLIKICKAIHERQLLIRYVSPEVFPLDKNNTLQQLFLTDLRQCKPIITVFKQIPKNCKNIVSPVGVTLYASINVGLGKEYGRRDDLEAIGYILIYFSKFGSLPWLDISQSASNEEMFKRITFAKRFIPIEFLCEGMDDTFAEYLRYVRTLETEETPDYGLWLNKFSSLI